MTGSVVDKIKEFKDPYPYFRGLVAEIGLPHARLCYTQPRRKKGITKNNVYTLYDFAMLGITNFSRIPLRLITFTGFFCSILCILVSLVYLVYKLIVLGSFLSRCGAGCSGFLLLRFDSALLYGYFGRIHRSDSHNHSEPPRMFLRRSASTSNTGLESRWLFAPKPKSARRVRKTAYDCAILRSSRSAVALMVLMNFMSLSSN